MSLVDQARLRTTTPQICVEYEGYRVCVPKVLGGAARSSSPRTSMARRANLGGARSFYYSYPIYDYSYPYSYSYSYPYAYSYGGYPYSYAYSRSYTRPYSYSYASPSYSYGYSYPSYSYGYNYPYNYGYYYPYGSWMPQSTGPAVTVTSSNPSVAGFPATRRRN
jgi:hypothetical protein